MNRFLAAAMRAAASVPRARGDEPANPELAGTIAKCSRARGDEPAHVGYDHAYYPCSPRPRG
ncbi:hypothetical protein [Halomonas sp. E19]|uniref:hypothetical protein n=1 Tax=Halomonas sp. E19 TaxID=3397247 RepID=UPI0040348D88